MASAAEFPASSSRKKWRQLRQAGRVFVVSLLFAAVALVSGTGDKLTTSSPSDYDATYDTQDTDMQPEPDLQTEPEKKHLPSLEEMAAGLRFTRAEYEARIPENSMGHRVYVVPWSLHPGERMGVPFGGNGSPWAKFKDDVLSLRFKVRSGDPDGFFKAECEVVGDFAFLLIRLRTNNMDVLNRERKAEYNLSVIGRARGTGHRAGQRFKTPLLKTTVRVVITDTNDLDPFFQQPAYTFRLPEDSPLHTSFGRVRADDADEGVNSEVYYSIVRDKNNDGNKHREDRPEDVFAVDPMTGDLSLVRGLDHKASGGSYEIMVAAQDRGAKYSYATRQADKAKVTVLVDQVNLHDPVMEVQHLPEVMEQSNTDIYALIRVVDPDPGRHGEVASLEIVDGDPEAHFRVRKSQGRDEYQIEVLRLLDREVAPFGYNLTLKAVDDGTPPRAAYKEVHVRLADLNDHPPVFEREVYDEVVVNETAPVNTPIVRLKVTDEDAGRNAEVRLKIVAGNEGGEFRLDPRSGVLFVAKPLDAEVRTAYTLMVAALDQANVGMRKQSGAKVRVVVLDENDNDPSFEIVAAVDRSDNVFTSLSTSSALDVYFDENEEAGTNVFKVVASDPDSGENGYVSYSLANVDKVPFEIDHFSGMIRSTELIDYESDRRLYHLVVRASDWGSPFRRQAEMRLNVHVRDVNDNRPQFERIGCSGRLPRSSPDGTVLLTLSALDLDASGNLVSYRIVGGNADSCFALDSAQGTLRVACDLRSNPSSRRQINVTATDGQHFADVTPVDIEIYDGDDDVNGGADAAGLFSCRDTDVARKLEKVLTQSKINNYPLVSQFAGTSAGTGDFFSGNRFGGSNIHSPEFDLANFPKEIHVNESVSVGTVLHTITAYDRDVGYDGKLSFVISEGSGDAEFRLETESGRLVVEGPLDREKTAEFMLNLTVYDEGGGPGARRSAWKLLKVVVDDENDNAPVFVKSAFSFFFPENTPVGTSVVKLRANDPDLGVNGKVSYFLDTDTRDFRVDRHSGLLLVAGQLNREVTEYYDLRVRAVDGSVEGPQSSFAVVRVRVLDLNDVPPRFTADVYRVRAREDLPVGSVVGVVHASDPDLYQGGQVRFRLDTEADDGFFEVDSVSGAVRIRRPLDYEERSVHNMTVKAFDQGSPVLTSSASFIVDVLDVNENVYPPRFESFFTRTAVVENAPAGTKVVRLTATDMDRPGTEDSRVSYSVRGGSGVGFFYIDADDGTVRTSVALDRESKDHYWLAVFAEDHGGVPLSSRIDVYIEVLDVNDNVPLTRDPVYQVTVPENSRPFTPLLTIEAFDSDAAADHVAAGMTYEIVSGNPQSLFFVDSSTGVLSTTNRLLDREVQDEHVLQVMVSDNGKPTPLNSTTMVIVRVSDENDNKPAFLDRFYKVSVPDIFPLLTIPDDDDEFLLLSDEPFRTDADVSTNGSTEETSISNSSAAAAAETGWDAAPPESATGASGGRPLFRVLARDEDLGENGKLKYSIKVDSSGGGENQFTIDEATAIVQVQPGVSLSGGQQFDMLVWASDKSDSSLARVSLTVVATNQGVDNAHPPRVQEKFIYAADILGTDPVGHLVGLVSASDKDGDPLWFAIVAGDPDHTFYVSPDKGSVVLAKPGYDGGRFNLTVAVTDGKFVDYAYVIVTAIRNSSSARSLGGARPRFVFGKMTKVEINESAAPGSLVTRLEVEEFDDTSLVVTFGIHVSQDPKSAADLFRIDRTTGDLVLKGRLDHEDRKQHFLVVSATTSSTKSSTAMAAADTATAAASASSSFHATMTNYAHVVVDVLDSNDHAPDFKVELLQAKVLATAEPGSYVAEVLAVDPDAGQGGEVSYSIVAGNAGGHFLIDEALGVVRLAKALLQDSAMTATSDDSNGPPRPPSSVPEEFMLTLRATDRGQPEPLFSNVLLHVLVDQDDDAPPRFERALYTTELYENLPRGIAVLQVQARRSRSATASVRFEIVAGNEAGMFLINPSTGTLMTQRVLDYEQASLYNLTVRAQKNSGGSVVGGFSDTCTCLIHVLDVNDNPPTLARLQFRGRVSESAPLGSLVLLDSADGPSGQENAPLVVVASDRDSGINSLLVFDILEEGEAKRFFRIDESTGAVRTAGPLDFELRTSFRFTVRVSDRGQPRLSSEQNAVIVIRIEDENDSPPVFASGDMAATLLLPTFRGVTVAQLSAHDPDTVGPPIKYSLVEGGGNGGNKWFSVDETTGAIQVARVEGPGAPDPAAMSRRSPIILEVSASDGKHAAKARVRIDVKKSDNSGLVFEKGRYQASVLENSTKSDVIAVVNVLGSSLNEDLKFSILNGGAGDDEDDGQIGSISEMFEIGRTSGAIRTIGRRPFDREKRDRYELVVEVRSSEGDRRRTVPRVAHAVVDVEVLDLNDNAPVFTNQPYFAVMPLGSPPDAAVLRVTAVDRDAGVNGEVFYQLVNGKGDVFRVGRKSGLITLRSGINDVTAGDQGPNRPQRDYKLTVKAYDGGTPPLSAEVVVYVKVVDKAAPVFEQQLYQVAAVREDVAPFTPLVTTKAIASADEAGKARKLFYTLDGDGLFSVDGESGVVSVVGKLDYESKRHHQLTVRAVDASTSSSSAAETIVLIEVEDANDCRPRFSQDSYEATVSESAPVGTVVIAVKAEDADEPGSPNSQVSYSFLDEGDHGRQFQIDKESGSVSLAAPIDYERNKTYLLRVVARDQGTTGSLTAVASVRVRVLDSNDNPPEFELKEYVVSVSEGGRRGQFVGAVRAVDPDEVDTGRLVYRIVSGWTAPADGDQQQHHHHRNHHHIHQVFRVAPQSGVLTLANNNLHKVVSATMLTTRTLFLNVTASDGVFLAVATVRVEVVASQSSVASSHQLVFAKSTYEAGFAENQPAGVRVGVVRAFSVISSSASSEFKAIQDQQQLRYSILSDEMTPRLFEIDQSSGEIWSSQKFDREAREVYELPLMVTDAAAGRNGFATFRVRIEDVDDNPPVFELEEYKFNVPANASQLSVVASVRAFDPDESGSVVRYSLHAKGEDASSSTIVTSTADVKKHFKIDAKSGQILVRQQQGLRGLENQVFQFFVRAQGPAAPSGGEKTQTVPGEGSAFASPHHADVPVELYVMSELDSPLTFDSMDAVHYVFENSPIGTVILTARASVRRRTKKTPVENESVMMAPKVVYSVSSRQPVKEGSEGLFEVDQEGRLTVSGHLDRETAASHRLYIMASTDTSPALNAYFEVTIQILDQNDNAPEFSLKGPYDVRVSEAIQPPSPVMQVVATDRDYGHNGEVRYSLKDHGDGDLFVIDSRLGTISVTRQLDFESRASYELTVLATDNGHHPQQLTSTATVRISVVDVNDNPPKFSQLHYSAAVNEGASVGTVIIQLGVEDLDKEAVSEVDFVISEGDDRGQFQVKKNGEIIVARSLDRESKPSYRLVVTATDGGTFVTSCKVSMEILDDNDSPPVCAKHHYFQVVPEDTVPGTLLLKVEASDADEDMNAKQIFRLLGPNSEFFSLDRLGGELRSTLPLDREATDTFYLEARVQDAGMLSWECSSFVEIKVSDTNDHSPVWTMESFFANVPEDATVGTILTKVEAVDPDLGDGGRVQYSLIESSPPEGMSHFRIDPTFGLVSLSKQLDREDVSGYILSLRAMDKGKPRRLSSMTRLEVTVLDVNDNPPEFTSKQYFSTVPEDLVAGTQILKLEATSRDTGINAEIAYFVVAGNEHGKFQVDEASGVLSVAGTLDREGSGGEFYFLTVLAKDKGTPPLSSTATVNLTVADINDNAPVFREASYSAKVNEADPVGSPLTGVTIAATDVDAGVNGRVRFRIVGGDQRRQFLIDEYSGVITVAGPLDREVAGNYVLEVEAKDCAPEPGMALSSVVLVHVEVGDANDNPPRFPETGEGGSGTYRLYLQEDKPPGHVLMRFDVSDADTEPNAGPFTFDIRSGNEDNLFRVVQDDGTLRTAPGAKFDHLLRDSYVLQVRVFDAGSPPLYSDAHVTVQVVEESRHPPEVWPLEVRVMSYLDDFPGAVVGRVKAADRDPYDQLVYELVPAATYHGSAAFSGSSSGPLFEIDQKKGSVVALKGLDAGSYTLNVSVSDGKFTTFSPAFTVKVEAITEEMLEAAVIARFAAVSPEKFISGHHEKSFVKAVRSLLNVKAKDVLVIGLQSSSSSSAAAVAAATRAQRRSLLEINVKATQAPPDLEVLFAVRMQKSASKDNAGGGFVNREAVRRVMRDNADYVSSTAEVTLLGVLEDECRTDTCREGSGTCQDLVIVDEDFMTVVASEAACFVSPRYHSEAVCACKSGFAGDRCEVILNDCALDPCPAHKVCVPSSSHSGGRPDERPGGGYACHCPEGFTGRTCSINVAACLEDGHRKCGSVNPVSMSGEGFVAYSQDGLANGLERTLNLRMGFRTSGRSRRPQTLMHIGGAVDYSVLEVDQHGRIRFRFDLGQGQGLLELDRVAVDDGEWHLVTLERRGNRVRLGVDGAQEVQGSAPGSSEVLNLADTGDDGFFVYFGARPDRPEVVEDDSHGEDMRDGFSGCLDDIVMDGFSLPVHAESSVSSTHSRFRLANIRNVEFGCKDDHYHSSEVPGKACLTNPCWNRGVCEDSPEAGSASGSGGALFKCLCQPRYVGPFCEVDSDPCASSPCLNGGRCQVRRDVSNSTGIGTTSGFSCTCPPKFSGSRCQYGKHCNPNPCQNGGDCEEGGPLRGPICHCRGFAGPTCETDVDECGRNRDQNPCSNGGTCVNTHGGFHCLCPPGFSAGSKAGPYCMAAADSEAAVGGVRWHTLKLEEVIGMIVSLFSIVLFVGLWVLCRRLCLTLDRDKAKTSGKSSKAGAGKDSSQGLKNMYQYDSAERDMAMSKASSGLYHCGGEDRHHLIELTSLDPQRRPLLSLALQQRPLSLMANNNETGYVDSVRSYGSAADELESLPAMAMSSVSSSCAAGTAGVAKATMVDFAQQQNSSFHQYRKPMAAVAPSVCSSRLVPHLQHPPLQGSAGMVAAGLHPRYRHQPRLSHLVGQKDLGESALPGYQRQQQRPQSYALRGAAYPAPYPASMDSPSMALKGTASLNSLPASTTADDTQKYFWDSFDLNNDSDPLNTTVGGAAVSMVDPLVAMMGDFGPHGAQQQPPGQPAQAVDPTRDIETLPEEGPPVQAVPGVSRIRDDDSDDEPQFGSVYPVGDQPDASVVMAANGQSNFERLLALNDGDINFVDAEDEMDDLDGGVVGDDDYLVGVNGECPNSYDYHLHLNNYLPQHNVSEHSETADEQTPMMGRHRNNLSHMFNLDPMATLKSCSDYPEDESSLGPGQGNGDNICELEDDDDDETRSARHLTQPGPQPVTPTKKPTPPGGTHKVTQV